MERLFTWGICETAALENYSQKCLNKNQREELLHYFDVRRRQKYISEAEPFLNKDGDTKDIWFDSLMQLMAQVRLKISTLQKDFEDSNDLGEETFSESIADNEGNIIYRKTLEENVSKTVIELSKNYNVCIHVYDNGKYIVSKEDFYIKSYVQIEKTVNVVYGLENINDYNFDKMLILGERNILDELKKEIDSKINVNSCFSGEKFLEIISKEANKGNALKWLCEKKGISIESAAAFGDNFNDIEMIEYAGTGVAMGNAEERVKQKADYIALSNNEDGVGIFLTEAFEL